MGFSRQEYWSGLPCPPPGDFPDPGIEHKALLSIGFFRQEYWNGLPCPPPGDLPNPGTEPTSPVSPALQADSLPPAPPGSPLFQFNVCFLELSVIVKSMHLSRSCAQET